MQDIQKKYVLIYDSECLVCSKFVQLLDNFSDKSKKYDLQLYVTSPPKIDFLNLEINLGLSKKNILNIKKLSKSTIILITPEKILTKSQALLETAYVLRPSSFIFFIIKKYFINLISIIIDPFYILFSKSRYLISTIVRKIFPKISVIRNTECLISSDRIKFI